jgi:hypothetical protein
MSSCQRDVWSACLVIVELGGSRVRSEVGGDYRVTFTKPRNAEGHLQTGGGLSPFMLPFHSRRYRTHRQLKRRVCAD